MPQFMQQLQNPAVQGMLTNPEALSAMNQIQQGLQRLHTAAPDVYQSMGMPSAGPGIFNPATTNTSTTTTSTSSTPTTTSSSPAGGLGGDAFAQLMNQMVNSMSSQGQNNPPEERFQAQLEQLTAMGFVDRQANIQGMKHTIYLLILQ